MSDSGKNNNPFENGEFDDFFTSQYFMWEDSSNNKNKYKKSDQNNKDEERKKRLGDINFEIEFDSIKDKFSSKNMKNLYEIFLKNVGPSLSKENKTIYSPNQNKNAVEKEETQPVNPGPAPLIGMNFVFNFNFLNVNEIYNRLDSLADAIMGVMDHLDEMMSDEDILDDDDSDPYQ